MKSKGSILIVFIMLIGLSFLVFSAATVVTTHVRQSGIKTSDTQAFYAAESGLSKAMWYLGTSVLDGGKGIDWRGTTAESFSKGNYEVTVQDIPVVSEVLIISTGEVFGIKKTITQHVNIEGSLPDAFDHSIFSNSGFNASGNAKFSGDILKSNKYFSYIGRGVSITAMAITEPA